MSKAFPLPKEFHPDFADIRVLPSGPFTSQDERNLVGLLVPDGEGVRDLTDGVFYPPTNPGYIKAGVGQYGRNVYSNTAHSEAIRLEPLDTIGSKWDISGNQVTCLAIVRRTAATSGFTHIFSNNAPSQTPYTTWGLQDDGNGNSRFQVALDNATNRIAAIPAGNILADGKWHVLIGTYDGTTLTLYMDGVVQATASLSGSNFFYVAGGSYGASIGNYANYVGGRSFRGEVYMCGLWTECKSAGWVKQVSAKPYLTLLKPTNPITYFIPSAGGWSISSVDLDNDIYHGQTGVAVAITGTVAASGKKVFLEQGGTWVEQTVTAEDATSATITVNFGSLSAGSANLYLRNPL